LPLGFIVDEGGCLAVVVSFKIGDGLQPPHDGAGLQSDGLAEIY
jgi:hypothetical protein